MDFDPRDFINKSDMKRAVDRLNNEQIHFFGNVFSLESGKNVCSKDSSSDVCAGPVSYDSFGLDNYGFDRHGNDWNGDRKKYHQYDQDGLDDMGFSRSNIDSDGYNHQGFSVVEGRFLDRLGFSVHGVDYRTE